MTSQKAVKSKKRDINKMGYVFVTPFVLVFLIFNLYPVLRTLYLSFTDYQGFGDAVFVGLSNYQRAVSYTHLTLPTKLEV